MEELRHSGKRYRKSVFFAKKFSRGHEEKLLYL